MKRSKKDTLISIVILLVFFIQLKRSRHQLLVQEYPLPELPDPVLPGLSGV